MILGRTLRDRLALLGAQADGDIDLAEAALALAAADRPRARLEPYRRHLAKMTAEVGAYAAAARGEPDIDR